MKPNYIKIYILTIVLFACQSIVIASDNFFGDSLLYAHSMRMYDSIRNEKIFFEMCDEGLKQAIDKKSVHFDYVFRTSPLAFYKVNNQKENFEQKAIELIKYYKGQQDIDNIYRVWENLQSQQLAWGDYVESVATAQEMSNYAQEYNHALGVATSNYCFGHSYNNNFQFDEALAHYQKAWNKFRELNSPGKSVESGLALCNIYTNKMLYNEVLAYTDSIPIYIAAWEKDKGNINPVFRVRLHRSRLLAHINLNNKEQARVAYDSMLYYNGIYADASQSIPVYYTKSRYLDFMGDHKESARMLKELTDYYVSIKNYGLASAYYRILGKQADKYNDKELAINCYRHFAELVDSANIATSTMQLNRLAKQFRLKELEQDGLFSRRVAWGVGALSLMLIILLSIYIRYSRLLLSRNRDLVKQIREREAAQALVNTLKKDLSPEVILPQEALFKKIQKLLSNKEVLAQQNLNRDTLAEMLSTNRNYIADAIRSCAQGLSVSLYISQQRVNYGRYLLESEPTLLIDDIADRCGFGSRSRFQTAFKEFYNLTPGDFRKAIK